MQAHPVRVSVIIPFFNTPEAFLREAVGSVLQQDAVSLELLLVNDGSDSVTTSIAEVLADVENPRVRHLTHPGGINKGTSATRNLGVAHAIGEYVAFLDSDDMWRAGKLKEQTELLDELPDVAMIFGLSEYWYDWQQGEAAVPSGFMPDIGAQKRRVLRPPQFVSDFLRGRIIVPNPSNFMVRRRAYIACGGFEESFPGMYEDQVFFAKLGLEHGVCVVPRCWDRYRQHPDSLTAIARETSTEEMTRRHFLKWLTDYIRGKGITCPEVFEAIAKELWLCSAQGDRSDANWNRRVRWCKKWLLRAEERLIPSRIRERWWGRRLLP